MNHLTLHAYEEDGELILYRCPEKSCGSTGPRDSLCRGHEAPLADSAWHGPKRKPVRVPVVGEEPRFTLEQLTSFEFLEAMQKSPLIQRQAPDGLGIEALRQAMRNALDHFTQQPAGGHLTSEEQARRGTYTSEDADRLRRRADKHSDGNQQPQGGEGGGANGRDRMGEDSTTRPHVAEGDSVQCDALHADCMRNACSGQCDGVALAQLELERNERLNDIADHIEAGLQITDDDAAFLRSLNQQSSGGQEADLPLWQARARTPEEGTIPAGQEGEVEECVIEGCELQGGHKGPHKAWRIIDAPYLEDRDHVEPWEDEIARGIAASTQPISDHKSGKGK